MLVKPPPRRSWGFTLIELMTTISVLAVLTLVALPAFQSFIANQRVRNASFDLMAALTLARSQAITQNGTVQLTKSGSAWNTGWTVTDGTRTFGSQEALPNISITDTNSGASVIYGKDGRITTTATKFTVQPSTTISGVVPRCIAIGLSGIPSSTQGAC